VRGFVDTVVVLLFFLEILKSVSEHWKNDYNQKVSAKIAGD